LPNQKRIKISRATDPLTS